MRYSTAENWAKYFKEAEGLLIDSTTIRRKLNEAGIIGKTGRDKVGRVLRNAFFSEADIRTICAHLLQPLPQTDEEGFFIKDGKKYGIISTWSIVIGIPKPTIKARIKIHNLQGIKGKDKNGQVRNFYPESAIRQICSDLVQDIPQADENGFFEKDGQKYGSIGAWYRVLRISQNAIRSRVRAHNPQNIKGKDKGGRIFDFYSESAIRQICSDLVQDIPQADENGLFIKNGKKYGTIYVLSKLFEISGGTLSYRIKTHNIQNIKGKDKNGHVRDFYSESAIRKICADILAKRNNS